MRRETQASADAGAILGGRGETSGLTPWSAEADSMAGMPLPSRRPPLSTRFLALPVAAALALGAGAGAFTYRLGLQTQRQALAMQQETDAARGLLLLARSATGAQFRDLLLQQPRDLEEQLRAAEALREQGRRLAAVLEEPLLSLGLSPVGAALEHLLRVQGQAAQAARAEGHAAGTALLRDGNWRLASDRLDNTLGEFIAARRAALDALEDGLWAGQLLGFGLMGASTLGMLGMMLAALAQLTRRRCAAEAARSEMDRHGRDVAALFRMGELLQSGQTAEDVKRVVAHTARGLLPEVDGAFYVFNNSRDRLDLLTSWGGADAGPPAVPDHFAPADCWALKRGRPHECGIGGGLACEHGTGSTGGCLCLPMLARGEVHGVLQFHPRRAELPAAERVALAHALADGVSLALANLALRERLRVMALRDDLTGLYNRRFLEETLARLVAHAERRGAPIAVLLVDLDHFKLVNDRHGHAAGDAVLREVGALLMAKLRRMDVACRYGGEELLVLMPDCTEADALARAEQLCGLVRAMRDGQDSALPRVTVSIGVAAWPERGATMEAVIGAADAALYAAKRAGRDRAVAAEELAPPAPRGAEPGAPPHEAEPGAPPHEAEPGAPPHEAEPGAPPHEAEPGAPPHEAEPGAPPHATEPGALPRGAAVPALAEAA
jgi:diguanylate cyclase (GGDEF)-like protein